MPVQPYIAAPEAIAQEGERIGRVELLKPQPVTALDSLCRSMPGKDGAYDHSALARHGEQLAGVVRQYDAIMIREPGLALQTVLHPGGHALD
ncbi:hypothetical protein [Sphingobium sp. CFD-2]|uniref:hypothetical protein n=1 Tax=Sphingobium sp. CFD-2 TaxID=2878542 RepID=UPI00214B4C7B|nr:hypothetical protein [Sphingobium sp. CFD-2]